MRMSLALAVFLSVCTIACGGPIGEAPQSHALNTQRPALASTDSLIGMWQMLPYPWKWSIGGDGNGYIAAIDPYTPYCWYVGAWALRNIEVSDTDPAYYTGEVNTCDSGWVPMFIQRYDTFFVLSWANSNVTMYRVDQ